MQVTIVETLALCKYDMRMNGKFRSDCPISSSLEIIGDKWSLLVLRDLIFFEKSSFKDFSQSKEGIATNILSDRLSKLESQGIIRKERSRENRRIYLYSITTKGIDLVDILLDMIVWGVKYMDHIDKASIEFAEEIRANRQGIIDRVRSIVSSE
jgi:DNA-binding HxlR family transcriptional regulator